MRRILFLGFFIYSVMVLTAVACIRQPGTAPSQNSIDFCQLDVLPEINQTAQAMAACLPLHASAEEAAQLLRYWQRAADQYWGGALSADLLPGRDAELILTYHASLSEVIWNPQGKIAVLQSTADGWQVVFESPGPTTTIADGSYTLAGNWSYHPVVVGDVTGDEADDLLVEQRWSNGAHSYLSFTKLLTAHSFSPSPDTLHIIYLEEGSRTYPTYRIVDQTIQATIHTEGQEAITQTYQLDGNTFALITETITGYGRSLSHHPGRS